MAYCEHCNHKLKLTKYEMDGFYLDYIIMNCEGYCKNCDRLYFWQEEFTYNNYDNLLLLDKGE